MTRRDLSAARLREVLDYDPETGHFTHKHRPESIVNVPAKSWNTRYAGKRAGCLNPDGYIKLAIDGRSYLAHRLAWLWVYGELPADMEIDHRDRNPVNNAISNLRLATSQQQKCNTGPRQSRHPKGCHWRPRARKWAAEIWVGGKKLALGLFKRMEDAQAARAKAEANYHGEFAYTLRSTADPERRAA